MLKLLFDKYNHRRKKKYFQKIEKKLKKDSMSVGLRIKFGFVV